MQLQRGAFPSSWLPLRTALDADRQAASQRVRRIENDLIGLGKARSHLDRTAVIMADRDRSELNPAPAYDPHAKPLRSEQERIRWNRNRMAARRKMKMHEDISSRKQRPLRVVDIDLDIQGAACAIDGVRIAHDRAGILYSGIRILSHRRLVTIVNEIGIHLRHSNINAQPSCRCKMKEFSRIRRLRPGVD